MVYKDDVKAFMDGYSESAVNQNRIVARLPLAKLYRIEKGPDDKSYCLIEGQSIRQRET